MTEAREDQMPDDTWPRREDLTEYRRLLAIASEDNTEENEKALIEFMRTHPGFGEGGGFSVN